MLRALLLLVCLGGPIHFARAASAADGLCRVAARENRIAKRGLHRLRAGRQARIGGQTAWMDAVADEVSVHPAEKPVVLGAAEDEPGLVLGETDVWPQAAALFPAAEAAAPDRQ